MGRISKALLGLVSDTIRAGVDLAKLPGVRSIDDLRLVIRTEAFLPLSNTLNDLNKVREATDVTTALHLLPLVDDATDARKLAAASEALGSKLIGRAEMLGKSRLFRATLRLSKAALGFAMTFSAFVLSLGSLCGHALQHLLVRFLKHSLRRKTA
jgi:hypothetical protein